MKKFAATLAMLAITCAASAATFDIDWSDLWWNASRSGEGYQFVQNNKLIAVTWYLYGPDDAPLWYSAALAPTGNNTYAGDVYYSAGGDFFGSATYTAANVKRTKVGAATFSPSSVGAGTLAYSITQSIVTPSSSSSFSVSKAISITRFTLQNEDYTGSYVGGYSVSLQNCSPSSLDGLQEAAGAVSIQQSSSGAITLVTNASGDTCTYSGTYTQTGKLGSATGTYSCTDSTQGTFTATNMARQWNGFTASVSGKNQYCTWSGSLGGIAHAQ